MALMTRRRTHKRPKRKPTKSGRGASKLQGHAMLMEYAHKHFPGARIRQAPPGTSEANCILIEHEKSGKSYICCEIKKAAGDPPGGPGVRCTLTDIAVPDEPSGAGVGPGPGWVPNYIRGHKARRRAARNTRGRGAVGYPDRPTEDIPPG